MRSFGISSENAIIQNLNEMKLPKTYKPLAPRDTVCAVVSIVNISRRYHNCVDHDSSSFNSRIDLCKDQGPTYRICLIPSSGVVPSFLDLQGLKKVEKKPRNTLYVEFERGFFIEIHFKYEQQFQYFEVILTEILRIIELTKKGTKVPVGDRGKYERTRLSTYKVRKTRSPRVMSGIPFSSGGIEGVQFFERHAAEWFLPELGQWVKHIYVQGRDMKKVMTLYDYIESLEQDIYAELCAYITETGPYTTGKNEEEGDDDEDEGEGEEEEEDGKKKKKKKKKSTRKRKSSDNSVPNNKTRNYLTLRAEIAKYESDPKTCNHHLQKALSYPLIRQTLKVECDKLEHSDFGNRKGYFDIDFQRVLTKRLNQLNLLESPKKISKNKKKNKKEKKKNKKKKNKGKESNIDVIAAAVAEKKTSFRASMNTTEYHQLRRIIDDLKTDHRYWWSVEDCRDHILSLLLHRKSLLRFIRDKETEFFRMEQTLLKKENQDDDDPTIRSPIDDPYVLSQRAQVLVDPDEWMLLLTQFNQKIGCRMHDVSYRVKIAYEQNRLREQRKEMLLGGDECKGELKTLQDELTANLAKAQILRDRCQRYDDIIISLACEGTPESEKRMKGAEMMIAKVEKSITDLAVRKKDIEIEMRALAKKNDNLEGLEELEGKIIFHRYENLMGGYVPFFTSERRRTAIREYFTKQLDILSTPTTTKENEGGPPNNNNNNNEEEEEEDEERRSPMSPQSPQTPPAPKKPLFRMSEIGVKLVISILKGHKPDSLQQRALSFLDKFYTPSFYQWGFIHASVQLANVGCHWLSSSFVTLTDLAIGQNYEELIAIDCHCPLIVNKHTIYERLNELAELIVSTNINYDYHLFRTAGDGYINCQVFAKRVIKNLKRTRFFPAVKSYLSELRGILESKPEQQPDGLRFLTVSDEFARVYSGVWEKKKKKKSTMLMVVPEDAKKRMLRKRFTPDRKTKRIYFNCHRDVDDFYNACENVLNEKDDSDVRKKQKKKKNSPTSLGNNNNSEFKISSEENAMDVKFPGEFQLLKGFDRAFWMGRNLGPATNKQGRGSRFRVLGTDGKSKFKPKNCPFIDIHKHEKVMMSEKGKILKETVRGEEDDDDDDEEEEEEEEGESEEEELEEELEDD